MFDVFGSLRAIIKLDSANIDNTVFRLHYKVTVILMIAFSLLVTSRQYIGDPISCIQNEVPDNIINTFCWIHATFSVPRLFDKIVGDEVVYPGVGPKTPNNHNEERVYHKYYQWVCFVLFFQAALFYIPRYLWKTWEGGKLKALVLELNHPVVSEETKKQRKSLILDYVMTHLHGHNLYAASFFVCEILNFINVIAQIYFVDKFLGGEFTTYGTEVIKFTETDQEGRVDPMIRVFPRITKCIFHKFGPSGEVQRHDALCVLPLNIVNEKIYVFIWFWFVLLAIVSGLGLIYRMIVIGWPKSRFYLMRSKCRLAQPDYVEIVVRKSKIGDWFLLYLLADNMDSFIFKEFLTDLARKFEGKEII